MRKKKGIVKFDDLFFALNFWLSLTYTPQQNRNPLLKILDPPLNQMGICIQWIMIAILLENLSHSISEAPIFKNFPVVRKVVYSVENIYCDIATAEITDYLLTYFSYIQGPHIKIALGPMISLGRPDSIIV